MNALMVIYPYRNGGIWAFDDDKVGLVREPFVGAINFMIDALTGDIPEAEKGVALTFSASNFPGSQISLVRTREEWGGNWYTITDCVVKDVIGIEGWLCPALFKYFPEAPNEIFVKVDRKN
jgi:hypothetical protein